MPIITKLAIKNFRAFSEIPETACADINVFIGENDKGKSSVLRAIHVMQDSGESIFQDCRLGTVETEIGILFRPDAIPQPAPNNGRYDFVIKLNADRSRTGGNFQLLRAGAAGSRKISSSEGEHLIVPFLSRRKEERFTEKVTASNAGYVSTSFENLPSRLMKVFQSSAQEQYEKYCREILGYVVKPIMSQSGLKPGFVLPNDETLSVEQLGEGVVNIVALLVALTTSEGKVFLIEELENDLHPKALKALLNLITEKSVSNQFFISTHSNIVLKHLGSQPNAKVFKVWQEDEPKDGIPTSHVDEVTTPEGRVDVLRELGYDFAELALLEGWLLLEESSAQSIIEEFLIPWFAPKLQGRIQVFAANGIDDVEPAFKSLKHLVTFIHLEEEYKKRCWIRIDGGEKEETLIGDMQAAFKTWPKERFANFSEHDFEKYYPPVFEEEVEAVLAIQKRSERRVEKRKLAVKVCRWLRVNGQEARAALEVSAADVIAHLRQIETEFLDAVKG